MSDYDNGWVCDECGCAISDSLGYCFNCDGDEGETPEDTRRRRKSTLMDAMLGDQLFPADVHEDTVVRWALALCRQRGWEITPLGAEQDWDGHWYTTSVLMDVDDQESMT